MSALGQKPTCALQKAMSALHPMRPRKRTWNFRTGNFVGRYCDRSSIRFWGVAGGGVTPRAMPPEAIVREVEGKNIDTTSPLRRASSACWKI